MPKTTKFHRTAAHKSAAKPRTSAARSKSSTRRFTSRHAGFLMIALVFVGWAWVFTASQPVFQSSAASCTVSDKLVNSCRPWLGAAVNNYPQAADDKQSQFLYHEKRIGRQLDIVHTYHTVGSNHLDDTDIYFAKRAGTYLFTNWKPAARWADASGSNNAINNGIDSMAASVKSLGATKLFMTLNHEPENDVSGGGSCTTYKGSAGTPAQYRAMWRNVETRFKNAGVTNVVWVMDYMNYAPWDCVVNDLYPGDDLVDWIMFNGYGHKNDSWATNVGRFYNFLTNNSTAQHNYVSKPWGIVEWSYQGGSSAQHSAYFDQVKAALDNNTFPRLKAYMVFDALDKGDANGANFRVGYDDNGGLSADQAAHYKAFATDARITGSGGSLPAPTPTPTPVPSTPPPTTKDTVPPTVTLTSPADRSIVAGITTVGGAASDNVRVTAVTMRIDNAWVATDGSAPYAFTVDTSKYKDGTHTVVLRAFDPTNNMGESRTVTIYIQNHGGGASSPVSTPPRRQTSITTESTTESNNPTPVTSTVVVNPSVPGSTMAVAVDGKPQPTNSFDTVQLTNGLHKITIWENGVQKTAYVTVENPFPVASLNVVRTNAAVFGTASGAVLALATISILRPYVFGLENRNERSIRRRQQRLR